MSDIGQGEEKTPNPGDNTTDEAVETSAPSSASVNFMDVVAYLLGSVMVLIGLFLLVGGVALRIAGAAPVSLPFLLSGILVLPVVINWLRLRAGFPRGGLAHTASVIGIFMVTAVFAGSTLSSQEPPNPVAANSIQPAGSTLAGATGTAQSGPPTIAPAASARTPDLVRWSYNTVDDKMRGTATKIASVVSDDHPEFEFPYAGGSTLTLWLLGERKGDVVELSVDKGQFICNPLGDRVSVKFDSGSVQQFECSDNAVGDTTTIFLHPARRFVDQLKRSRQVTVEPAFFQAGVRQVTFLTGGLQW